MAKIDYTAAQITRMIQDAVVAQETVGNYAINKYRVPNYDEPNKKSVGEAATFQGDPETGMVKISPRASTSEEERAQDWYNTSFSSGYPWKSTPEGVAPDRPTIPLSLGKYKFILVSPYGDPIPEDVNVSAYIWVRQDGEDSIEKTLALGEEFEFEVRSLVYVDVQISIIVDAPILSYEGWEPFNVFPFLCRSEIFGAYMDESMPYIPYVPDLQTQIRQSGGGYNEVRTENFTDNVQEVTI